MSKGNENINTRQGTIKIYINKTAEEFVGIKINRKIKDYIEVRFPIGYHLQNNGSCSRKDIFNLMNSLQMNHNNTLKENENTFSIVAALKVMENYLEYGLFKETTTITQNNTEGKINWKKTIANSIEYLVMKDTNQYINIYSDKINYKAEGKIQKIQKYCLGQIALIIGPFYKFNYPVTPMPYSKLEMIEIVEKELQNVNQDSKKEVLTYISLFLKETTCIDLTANKKQVLEYGTRYYQYIWENIIDTKFKGLEDISKYKPRAQYFEDKELTKPYSSKNKSVLRPDTIIKNGNTIIILDAKYYKNQNLPGEYDINKQLRYAEYVYNYLEKKVKIYNMFMLPKDLEDESTKYKIECYATNAEYVDNRTKEENKKKLSDGIGIIATCYIDTKALLELDSKALYEQMLNKIVNEMLL